MKQSAKAKGGPKGKERRKQERGKAEQPPLTPEEWRIYEAQKEELRRRVEKEREQAQYEYETGLLCKKIKDDGYWARDPANKGKKICQVLCEITNRPGSLSTFDRRIRLVRFYTLARVLELAGKGVSIMAMVECTYQSPLLHEALLTLACKGLSISKLSRMRKAGNRELRKQLKGEEAKPKPSESEACSAALLAMMRALEGDGEDEDEDEDGPEEKKEEELDEETQAALKMREADLRIKEAELREREAEIHEVQRRLKEEEERLLRRELVAGLGPDPGPRSRPGCASCRRPRRRYWRRRRRPRRSARFWRS